MAIRSRIEGACAPKAWGSDRPGKPSRIQQMQVPSDRLRDKARDFLLAAVGLVPEPKYHELLVDVVHDTIVVGERALQAHLESQPEWKRDGFKVQGEHAPMRAFGAEAALVEQNEKLRAELAQANESHEETLRKLMAAQRELNELKGVNVEGGAENDGGTEAKTEDGADSTAGGGEPGSTTAAEPIADAG